MDNPPAPDKSLLERLNALKPSSVSLGTSALSRSRPASTIDQAKSPSRADALTSRLKSLRSQVSESESGGGTNSSRDHSPNASSQHRPAVEVRSITNNILSTPQSRATVQSIDNVDSLPDMDDQTLEDLLEDLRSDDAWLNEIAAEEEEHQRAIALLAELGKSDSANSKPSGQYSSHDHSSEDSGESSDDGESSEAITIEVDSIVTKAVDEVEWEQAQPTPSSPLAKSTPFEDTNGTRRDTTTVQKPGGSSMSLPTVPSTLQDQPDAPTASTQTQSDVDFAASIASRMAALKMSGTRALPSAPTTDVDSLGLPQVPTFTPADRPVLGLAKRTVSMGEESKNWCVVCLEDGAIRCRDCDAGDDIYCARCWKAMHVGPSAGYDERGHAWETFSSKSR